jgi:hypothetical protein
MEKKMDLLLSRIDISANVNVALGFLKEQGYLHDLENEIKLKVYARRISNGFNWDERYLDFQNWHDENAFSIMAVDFALKAGEDVTKTHLLTALSEMIEALVQ